MNKKKVKCAIIASCWWLVAAVGAETPHRDPIRAIIENVFTLHTQDGPQTCHLSLSSGDGPDTSRSAQDKTIFFIHQSRS